MLKDILEKTGWVFEKTNKDYNGLPTLTLENGNLILTIGFDRKDREYFVSVVFMSDDREERKEWVKQYGKNGFRPFVGDEQGKIDLAIDGANLKKLLEAMNKTFGVSSPGRNDLENLLFAAAGF
jgi:hypothetical protein